jgi:hypothetical protein
MNWRTFLTSIFTSLVFAIIWTSVILWFYAAARSGPSGHPPKAATPKQTDKSQASINPELKRIFDEDQRDGRPYNTRRQREETDGRARSRIDAVSEIIKKEQLQSPDDYYHAAIIFQHGSRPEDYLMAHVLASVAGFKGHRRGAWLTAASLDQFLLSLGRPQIFGTIYGKGGFERYEAFLSDAIRSQYCVPPREVRVKNEEAIRRGAPHFQRWAKGCE